MDASGWLHGLVSLPPGKHPPGTYWSWEWVVSRARLDVVEYRKVSCPCMESNPGRLACSPSLFWVIYIYKTSVLFRTTRRYNHEYCSLEIKQWSLTYFLCAYGYETVCLTWGKIINYKQVHFRTLQAYTLSLTAYDISHDLLLRQEVTCIFLIYLLHPRRQHNSVQTLKLRAKGVYGRGRALHVAIFIHGLQNGLLHSVFRYLARVLHVPLIS
jgi:hypothetical protein